MSNPAEIWSGTAFSELSLDGRLLIALNRLGFSNATEIQRQALPWALSQRDLIASSQTGSGKTLAYLLPTMQRLLTTPAYGKNGPRVLILAPSRELAHQVHSHLRPLLSGTHFKATLVVGGEDFNEQAQRLRRETDIIIATPGRMADHLQHREQLLDHLELLILDEADRMLKLGFIREIKEINRAAADSRRQTMLFSATLDHEDFETLAKAILKDPERMAIHSSIPDQAQIEQRFYQCDHLDHKEAILDYLLVHEEIRQAIIFTATREDTQRLAQRLNDQKNSAIALHGKMNQGERNRIMDEFRRGKQRLLVTTDVASRGLDLRDLSHVFNFDLPKLAEEYVHRIGRTGRMGRPGKAISLVGPKDQQSLQAIKVFLNTSPVFATIEDLPAKRQPSLSAKGVWDQSISKEAKRGEREYQRLVKKKGKEAGFSPVKKRKQ